MSQQAAPAGPAPATGYFVDQRKGEVNELKQVVLINHPPFFSYSYQII